MNEKDNSRKAVIYARVSSTTDRQTTDRQVADLTDYAQRNNIKVLASFTEHCSGAVETAKRKEWQRCMEFCQKKDIDLVLVTEISRIGRNAIDVLNTIQTLTSKRINVFVLNYGLNTLSPDGSKNPVTSMILGLLSEFAELERGMIKDRLKSGYERARAKGVRMGRPEGKITPKQLLAKYPNVVKQLQQGYKQKDIARLNGISESTVLRINRALKGKTSQN